MSLNIVKQMLDKKPVEPADPAKVPRQKKKLTYKELLRAEQKKREDEYLLRLPKKKSAIRKRKDNLRDSANLKKNFAKTQNESTIVERIENDTKKEEEQYKERIKTWKQEFHGKGKVASSIAKSVPFFSPRKIE